MASILKSDGKPMAQEVEPVKDSKDIQKIRQYLKGKDNPRDYCLWVCGTNFMLRAGDLLSLRWSDILEDENTFRGLLRTKEEKTDKNRRIKINDDAREALLLLKGKMESFDMNDYIFQSRKGKEPLTVGSLHKIIKTTLRDLRIKGNFGSHTLRKTGAYKVYTSHIQTNPSIISYLQRMLNHSSQAVTLRYIGIEAEEIDDIYDSIKW